MPGGGERRHPRRGRAGASAARGLALALAAAAPAAAAKPSALGDAVEGFWVFWSQTAGRVASAQQLRDELMVFPARMRLGDPVGPEFAAFASAHAPLARALERVRAAADWEALPRRRLPLREALPGPALMRRVHLMKVMAFHAQATGDAPAVLRRVEGLLYLGSLVARGREGEPPAERLVHRRLGMEVQLVALEALQRALTDDWSVGDELVAPARALLRQYREVPTEPLRALDAAERSGWLAGPEERALPAGGLPRMNELYRAGLRDGLLRWLELFAGPGERARTRLVDPMSPEGRGFRLRLLAGGLACLYSVGADGVDDGGDHERDLVVAPFPANGRPRANFHGN